MEINMTVEEPRSRVVGLVAKLSKHSQEEVTLEDTP